MASKDRGERRFNPVAVPTALHLNSLLAPDSVAFVPRPAPDTTQAIMTLPSSDITDEVSFVRLAEILRGQQVVIARLKGTPLQSSGWDALVGYQGSDEYGRQVNEYRDAVRQGSRGARSNLAGEMYADVAYRVLGSSRNELVFDPDATVDFLHLLAFKDREVTKIPFGRRVIKNLATPDGLLFTEENGVVKLASIIDYKASISEPVQFYSQHEKYLAMLDGLIYRAPAIASAGGVGIEYILPFPDGQFSIPKVPARKPSTVFTSLDFDSTQFSIFVDGVVARNRPNQGVVFMNQSRVA